MMALGRHDLVLCAGTLAGTPLPDRLEPARRAGFSAVSVFSADYEAVVASGMTACELRTRTADHGLTVAEFDPIGNWLPDHLSASASNAMTDLFRNCTPERICPIAEAIGARSVTVLEPFGLPIDTDLAAESFANLCDRAANHGLLVHLEFVPFGGIPNVHSAWDIVQRAGRDNGGLLVDSWHLFRSGSSATDLRNIPGKRIFGLQFNDAPATARSDLFDEAVHHRLLPGEGDFDLFSLIAALDEIGCTAPCGVEVFSDTLALLPAEVAAQQAGDAMRALLALTFPQNQA